jgi:hypothetical protein
MRASVAAVVFVASCSTMCFAQDVGIEALLKQAEEPIQQQLRLVVEALAPSNQASLRERIANLHDSVADKNEIVKQIAVYAASPGEGQPLLALGLLQTLELPPSVVIRGLAPYLDAENKNLRSFVRDWFQGHDNAGPTSSQQAPVNYQDYYAYVRERMNAKQEIPAPFVDYVFERSPGEAVLIFNKADRLGGALARLQGENIPQEDVALAERVVSNAIWFKQHRHKDRLQAALPDAKSELLKLGSHEQWWARRYVAEIMRRHPELRQDDVLQKLRKDSEESVSKVAKSVKE